MIWIVDASVAIKWFVPTEEYREQVLQVLEDIQKSPQRFGVPELFFNEVLTVLCRVGDHVQNVIMDIDRMENLGLNRVGNGHELLEETVRSSKKYHLTGYDALYVATAKLMKGVWLTADYKAYKRITDPGLACFLPDYCL